MNSLFLTEKIFMSSLLNSNTLLYPRVGRWSSSSGTMTELLVLLYVVYFTEKLLVRSEKRVEDASCTEGDFQNFQYLYSVQMRNWIAVQTTSRFSLMQDTDFKQRQSPKLLCPLTVVGTSKPRLEYSNAAQLLLTCLSNSLAMREYYRRVPLHHYIITENFVILPAKWVWIVTMRSYSAELHGR